MIDLQTLRGTRLSHSYVRDFLTFPALDANGFRTLRITEMIDAEKNLSLLTTPFSRVRHLVRDQAFSNIIYSNSESYE